MATAAFAAALSTAGNLAWNPGFEEVSRETGFAAYWGINAAYPGKVGMVEDAAAAHRGSRCVEIQQTGKVFAGMHASTRFDVGTNRELHVSLWLRGSGTVTVAFYLYSQPPEYIGAMSVGTFTVTSDEWTRFTGVVTIPETSNLAKKAPKQAHKACLALHVTGGPVLVDDITIFRKGDMPEPPGADVVVRAEREPVPHTLTIPATAAPPTIDGTMAPGEWDRAAAVTGFHELGGDLASRQTVVYMTYDDTHLYIAFDSIKDGRLYEGSPGRDSMFERPHDAIEVWLMPPESDWFQFYGVPGSGFLDLNKSRKLAWNADWKYANTVTDTGELAGEIQTFSRKRWVAEIAIRFKDLGRSVPGPDEVWRVNFCRDWSEEKGHDKKSEDWTTWSYIDGSFAAPGMFSFLHFGGQAPALQVTGLGDLPSGNLHVTGRVSAASGARVSVSASLVLRDGSGRVVYERTQPFEFPRDGTREFTFTDTIRVRSTTDMRLTISASSPDSNRELTRIEVPFTAVSSFAVKPVPIFAKGFMEVVVDASRLPDLPAVTDLRIEVSGTPLIRRVALARTAPAATERFELAGIAPGEYLVRAVLTAPDGTAIASSSEPLTVPERPAWLDNTVGIIDGVPPPWTPLEIDGQTARMVLREYRLGNNGLPQQITAVGKEILAGPMELQAVVNGRPAALVFEPLQLVSATDRRATWRVRGAAAGVTVGGRLWLEFDGFALLTFDVSGAADTTLDELAFVVPLRKAFALYARGRRQLPISEFVSASLYPDTFAGARPVDVGDRNRWFYSPGWQWSNTVFNELFVGGDTRGIAFLTETDQYIRGETYADFTTAGDTVTLRINLVSTSTNLDRPLHYEYGYITLPVKPRPADPRLYQPSYFATDKHPEFNRRQCVAVNYHILANINTPAFRNPRAGQALVKLLRDKYDVGVVADTYMSAASTTIPEYALFGHEWDVIPRDGWVTPTGRVRFACQSTSHAQFYLDCARRMVEEMGLGGVYIDVSGPIANSNPYSGCGYVDEAGVHHPTVPLWASREMYQRLYTYLHTGGRNGIIYSHGMHESCIGGYVDMVTEGEYWGTERRRQYTRLSPDMFRAMVMKTQFGTPFTFYIFHQYSWRGNAYGTPVSLDSVLMMSLVHGVLVSIGDQVGMREIPPVWDLVSPFLARSEFLGYWRDECPVSTGSEQILASVYLMPGGKEALVVVSNWGYELGKGVLTIDWEKLGMEPARTTVTEPLDGDANLPSTGRLELALAARAFRVLLFTAR